MRETVAGAEMLTPIGVLAPLPDVFLVMRAEVVTIPGTEMVRRAARAPSAGEGGPP